MRGAVVKESTAWSAQGSGKGHTNGDEAWTGPNREPTRRALPGLGDHVDSRHAGGAGTPSCCFQRRRDVFGTMPGPGGKEDKVREPDGRRKGGEVKTRRAAAGEDDAGIIDHRRTMLTLVVLMSDNAVDWTVHDSYQTIPVPEGGSHAGHIKDGRRHVVTAPPPAAAVEERRRCGRHGGTMTATMTTMKLTLGGGRVSAGDARTLSLLSTPPFITQTSVLS